MTTDRVTLGTRPDGSSVDLVHQEISDAERRVLRAEYLLTELDREQVQATIDVKKLSPGTVEFIQGIAEKVMRIQAKELQPEDILQLELERLEDAHMWTRKRVELTEEEKEKVIGWCRRDGFDELANDIQAKIENERKDQS